MISCPCYTLFILLMQLPVWRKIQMLHLPQNPDLVNYTFRWLLVSRLSVSAMSNLCFREDHRRALPPSNPTASSPLTLPPHGAPPTSTVVSFPWFLISASAASFDASATSYLLDIQRESTTLYTCCQEIQEPWPLAPKLGAKAGRQAVPRLWDTFNILGSTQYIANAMYAVDMVKFGGNVIHRTLRTSCLNPHDRSPRISAIAVRRKK